MMTEFIELYAPFVARCARAEASRVRGIDANDVAQAVLARLIEAHAEGRFEPARLDTPEAYLRTVVRNAATRVGRRAKAEPIGRTSDVAEREGVDELPDPELALAERRDARVWLQTVKARLRPRDALAFALLVEDGCSIDEAARALGTNANNVYQMRHRILQTVRELEAVREAS